MEICIKYDNERQKIIQRKQEPNALYNKNVYDIRRTENKIIFFRGFLCFILFYNHLSLNITHNIIHAINRKLLHSIFAHIMDRIFVPYHTYFSSGRKK